jgi:hypothetical protein
MARFTISLSVGVEADDYEDAYRMQQQLHEDIGKLPYVSDTYEIDVEQQVD